MIAFPISVMVLFSVGGTLIITSGFILYAMIGKVNRKLPDNEQISYVFFYPTKALKITRKFRHLYPRSHLNTVRIVLNVLGFLLIAACAAQLNRLGR